MAHTAILRRRDHDRHGIRSDSGGILNRCTNPPSHPQQRVSFALTHCVSKLKPSTPRHAPPRRSSPTSTTIAPDLGGPEIGSSNGSSDRWVSGQRKHRELAAERFKAA